MPKRLNRVCFNVTIRSPSFQEYPLNTDAAGNAPPDAFGPFRVLHQIGAGALGPVFRAYQPEQDRLVAVKVFRIDIPPERTHQLVAQLERLIAADLSHAGIAAPLATGIADVAAYLAMDFVAADSLDMVIRDQQATSPSDVVRIATQLASALDLAAAIDITHGVLHPRDVLLSADDVRMTGIGIAQALEEVGFSAPVRRPYTAPERANGRRWDRRADVFSLAALVFELLTRRRISGPGDQPLDSFARVAGVSADALDKVFDRALAERPHDRFASAGDFARALEAAVEKKRSVAGRVGPSIRPPIPEPEVEPSTPVAAEELPLFTDSLLGEEPDMAAAADATPPPLLDPSHEALAPEVPFRDAPLSTVESLHEPELRPHHPGPVVADIHSTPPVASGHRVSINDFSEAVREVPLDEPAFNVVGVFATEADVPTRPGPFESVEAGSRSSSGVWPLMLALIVGIALGFGMAMLLLGRDRVPLAPTQAATSTGTGRAAAEVRDEPIREVTEQTVAVPPKAAAPPSADTTTAEPPRPVPDTPAAAPAPAPRTPAPAPAASASANVKPGAAKPTATTPSKPAVGRNDNRAANAPSPRAQARPPAAATKSTPTRPGTTTRATPASGRGANRAATPPEKAAPQTAPKAGSGSLVVESRPPGASVFVDGRRVGTTPLVLDTVKAGQYTIGLDIDGYKRWATSVRVTSGERSRVAASLER